MDKPKLADREAALIEAARRELAAGAPPTTPTGPPFGQTPGQTSGRTSEPTPQPDPGLRAPIERPALGPAMAEAPIPTTAMQRSAIPEVRPDAAARIAALMQVEQEETSRRKRRLRQFGVVIPALALIAATLWVVIEIFRYARM